MSRTHAKTPSGRQAGSGAFRCRGNVRFQQNMFSSRQTYANPEKVEERAGEKWRIGAQKKVVVVEVRW